MKVSLTDNAGNKGRKINQLVGVFLNFANICSVSMAREKLLNESKKSCVHNEIMLSLTYSSHPVNFPVHNVWSN